MRSTDTAFSLFIGLGRLIKSRMHAHACPTLPQLETLDFIARTPHAPTMRELAGHLRIKAPSATVLVDELVRARLVVRAHGTLDKRAVGLALTAHGRRMLKQSTARREKVIGQLLKPLSARDRAALNRILARIIATNQ